MGNNMETDNLQNQLQAGKKALNAELYAVAIGNLLPCAEAGNAEAQANVGFLYFMGLGVERDLKEAVKWLRQAMAQGRGDAAHNLATLYLTCEPELPRQSAEARNLYLKAYKLGFAVASDEWYNQMRSEPTQD